MDGTAAASSMSSAPAKRRPVLGRAGWYPEGSRAGVAVRSDRLPQAVRASRSCDHPHND
jgi:hypothetical protein